MSLQEDDLREEAREEAPVRGARPLAAAAGVLARVMAARGTGLLLVLVLLMSATLVAGPWPGPTSVPLPGQEGAPGQTVSRVVVGARSWPAWMAARGEAPVWAGGPRPSSTSSASLVAGYRGWPPAPPAALLAANAGPAGEADPTGSEVRGIYLTGYTAGNPVRFQELLELVDRTALNAMVINIKPETGRATYDTQVQAFREAGAVAVQIEDIEALLRVAEAYGIYTIGRLVVFNDSTLPRYNPDLAVKTRDGRLWRDHAGNYWSDPFRPEVWEYNIALAEEAARLGFDEIQFDYVRFPTDGDTEDCVFSRPSGPDNANRVRAITEFLRCARERLAPYGVPISADVFGIICSTRVDTSLGQVLEEVAEVVDYISPMIYPSHYGPGHFGLPDPDAEPYLTVHGALADALERLGPEAASRLRPWLQDFTLRNHYGPEEVLDQIRATHKLGIKGWLLWNPANRYSVAALRAYTVNQEAYLAGTD